MSPEEAALKISLYFAECQQINAQPRISHIADIIRQCIPPTDAIGKTV